MQEILLLILFILFLQFPNNKHFLCIHYINNPKSICYSYLLKSIQFYKVYQIVDSNLPNSFLNYTKDKSEIINLVQQRSQLKTLQITNSHRIFNGYQKEQSNQLSSRSRMILGKDDQVISEFAQSDIMIPPFISLLESSIEAESSIKTIQNIQINCIQPNVKKQYKLPQSIQFIHFIPKDGFKCLQ
ncbi:unnamed protein product [Paramecium pentaurelia]|uniref:Transmembrane protein n=1 Tax=Paramecium pentaurelia TaxID=43138 RepID=A0A8S1X0T1_9CILI|nr:unnamed protein product [Paramecium pentaurelia]